MERTIESCPRNFTETVEASKRLGCGRDKYGNDQYICLPNIEKTSLVEFCHNGIMGLIQRGQCLETTEGKLFPYKCSKFVSGCPDVGFRSNEIYKYPACQNISSENGCYLADPSCANTEISIEETPGTKFTEFTTDHVIYNTTAMDINTTTYPEDNSAHTGAILGSLVAVLILILLLILVRVMWKRMRTQRKQENDESSIEGKKLLKETGEGSTKQEETDVKNEQKNNEYDAHIVGFRSKPQERRHFIKEVSFSRESNVTEIGVAEAGVQNEKNELVFTETDANSELEGRDYSVIETNVKSEPEESEQDVVQDDFTMENLGDYNLWRTKISDHFSTLTDDEVFLLFCFLCSDSGPPDFADTEWLDLLNEIRKDMYDKENHVTREEAQKTLDALKSRDYLWINQDKITEDTEIETMYKIASLNVQIPFFYCSYNTVSVYLRSRGYNRKPGEKCIISDDSVFDAFLVRRLQMNLLTHVIMEDRDIYHWIYLILAVSENIVKDSKNKREKYLIDLRKEGEPLHFRGRSQNGADHVTWLWRYKCDAGPAIVRSCIGLHPHWDIYIIDNKAYRKPSKYHNYMPEVRSSLYCLLILGKYQNLNEQSHRNKRDNIRQRYFPDITDDDLVNLPDGITETHDSVITFVSDDIRHDVMYAFVTECLVEDSDLEFFLTTASRDVISEYCRSWHYERSEGERCLYVPDSPEKMYDLFIDKLQLDIITHCTLSDRTIHNRISERLGVPREVLDWDQEARERYVEYAKRGTQTVHHVRGMIVGCAGAGKTTLLKRLLGCSEEEIKEVKSTEGLEVHEEIFEVCDENNSLKSRTKCKDDKNAENYIKNDNEKTLTFFDFGGQCAYYACHQIYLTRRAFYVVVVDGSKRLDQKVEKAVCDQDGSVFSGWTYGDYFAFWIKSIHTYCGSDNGSDPKPIVHIVATHWEDENRQFQTKNKLMESLRCQFNKFSKLSQYISKDNCHCVQFAYPLYDLERCFFNIATDQRWKENIPTEWSLFGIECNLKKLPERIIKISEITTTFPEVAAKGQESSDKGAKGREDMLRYHHDAGKVLHFHENGLDQDVIIDVQWFIDAFKHIITDELHFRGIPGTRGDWDEYYKTGHLRDGLLIEIWKHEDKDLFEKLKKEKEIYSNDITYEEDKRFLQHHKTTLLNFMQRLGLLVIGKGSYYVPCMNRKEVEEELSNLINKSESKSSVLIYQFDFLPFFLYFRLIVACMQEKDWKVRESKGTSCLFRDAALFSFIGYYIVLSVTEDSIQLQVIHPIPGCTLERVNTRKIQERVEGILDKLVGTFHRKLKFLRGFRCQINTKKVIAMDIKGHFIPEKDIPREDQEIICPLHSISDRHIINTTELTGYWNL